MTKLFIIGNGFDTAHCLKTSYSCFRNYLLESYPKIDMYDSSLPDFKIMPDGGIKYNDEQVLSTLFYLLNEAEMDESEWNKIESSLGYLNYNLLYDNFEEVYDKDGTINYWHTAQRNEDIASDLIIPITSIQDYFKEWIESIDLTKVKSIKKFKDLIEKNDKFLTFNYTNTLEKVYDVKESNICHIHGNQYEDIYFGHGNNNDSSEVYMQSNIGSEVGLSKIDDKLRKRTDKALKENLNFFNYLGENNVEAIFSYGFSFNSIDSIYIKKVCSQIDTRKVLWYLDDYDLKNIESKKSKIREYGFKGDFKIYSIK